MLLLQIENAPSFDKIMRAELPEWHILSAGRKKTSSTQVEKASLINRLGPDFFLTITLTINAQKTPSCSLYSFAWTQTDKWPKQTDFLYFFPFFQTHYVHAQETYTTAFQLHELFKKRFPTSVQTAYYECPFKPLEGILCPAIAIEFVLPSLETWNTIEPLAIESIKLVLPS